MSDGLIALQEEDVQRLVRLIESLDSSTFDYLQFQVGDVKVTIGKGAVPMSAPAVTAPVVIAPEAPAYVPPPRPASVAAAQSPPVQTNPSAKPPLKDHASLWWIALLSLG